MMTALVLTVVCSFFNPYGNTGLLDVRYEHEWPPGQLYTYSRWVELEPGEVTITAEGWPYLPRVVHNGVVVGQCSYTDTIFKDGFEQGDAGSWR